MSLGVKRLLVPIASVFALNFAVAYANESQMENQQMNHKVDANARHIVAKKPNKKSQCKNFPLCKYDEISG